MINCNSPSSYHMHSNLHHHLDHTYEHAVFVHAMLDICTFLMYRYFKHSIRTLYYSMYRFHVQHSIHCTVCTDHMCWLQWNCWGQTTVFQKPLFVDSNEDQQRHASLYILCVCVCIHKYITLYRCVCTHGYVCKHN